MNVRTRTGVIPMSASSRLPSLNFKATFPSSFCNAETISLLNFTFSLGISADHASRKSDRLPPWNASTPMRSLAISSLVPCPSTHWKKSSSSVDDATFLYTSYTLGSTTFSARSAFGLNPIPAPISVKAGARSYSVYDTPRFSSPSARMTPVMPPPTIATWRSVLVPTAMVSVSVRQCLLLFLGLLPV